MVLSDRDHGYSGPCRLLCKSDGRRASATSVDKRPPASQPSLAGAASAAQQEYSDTLPYPNSRSADLFRG